MPFLPFPSRIDGICNMYMVYASPSFFVTDFRDTIYRTKLIVNTVNLYTLDLPAGRPEIGDRGSLAARPKQEYIHVKCTLAYCRREPQEEIRRPIGRYLRFVSGGSRLLGRSILRVVLSSQQSHNKSEKPWCQNHCSILCSATCYSICNNQ